MHICIVINVRDDNLFVKPCSMAARSKTTLYKCSPFIPSPRLTNETLTEKDIHQSLVYAKPLLSKQANNK